MCCCLDLLVHVDLPLWIEGDYTLYFFFLSLVVFCRAISAPNSYPMLLLPELSKPFIALIEMTWCVLNNDALCFKY